LPDVVCNTSPIQYLHQLGLLDLLVDALARRVAAGLGLRLTGTLGILLSAKRIGLLSAVTPALDRLQRLRFHLAPQTRAAVLTLAGES